MSKAIGRRAAIRRSIKNQEERQRILAQIPDGPPTCHDLAPLEPSNAVRDEGAAAGRSLRAD